MIASIPLSTPDYFGCGNADIDASPQPDLVEKV